MPLGDTIGTIMAEVSSSTLGGVRNVAPSALSSDFDVRSWQGLTKLLKAGKDSGMDPSEYAHFRNLVLSYAQGGGSDKAMESEIASIASSFNLKGSQQTPVADVPRAGKKPEQPAQQAPNVSSTVSTARPVRANGTVFKKTPHSTPRPTPRIGNGFGGASPTDANQTQGVPNNLPTATKAAMPESAPIHAVADQRPPEEKVSPIKTQPQQMPAPQPKKEVVPPAPRVPTPPTPQPTPAPPMRSLEENRMRIADIKHEVNARVGNPVTLAAEDNKAGRAYMTALLAAMKAVNGGVPSTVAPAMQALEAAAKPLMEMMPGGATALQNEPIKKEVPAAAENKTSSEKETKVPQRAPEVTQNTPPQPAPKLPQVVRQASEQNVPAKPKEITQTPPPIPPKPIQQTERAAAIEAPPQPPTPKKKGILPSLVNDMSTENTSIERAPTASPVEPTVAKQPSSAPAEQPTPNATGEDRLHTSEVTDGLHQLLAEWKLFQSSGIFGTGRGGEKHPLYKKLAPLPMSIVGKGAWEGATRDAIFSIRDYLNGWREEQGVAYLPEESFEHYLRRVVERILRRRASR